MAKVTVLINGHRKMELKDSDPVVRLLVFENPGDYEHSIAPNKVILEFDNEINTYELPGCPRCLNEAAKRSR